MGHDHDHAHAPDVAAAPKKNLTIAAALTGLFCAVEFAGGWVSGSLALFSDAGHMLIDLGSLVFVLISLYVSQRPPSAEKTYGYYRLEIIAALANGALLALVAFEILRGAWSRLGGPAPAIDAEIMLTISLAGLAVNLLCAKLLHGFHHHIGARSAYYHVLSDMLSSVGVVLASLAVRFLGWTWADPVTSVVIAAIILWNSKNLVSESVNILLESAPSSAPLEEVQKTLLAIQGVEDVHDLHVWTIGSGFLSTTAHLSVYPMDIRESEKIVRAAAKTLKSRFGINHATFQVEAMPAPRAIDAPAR